MKLFQAFFSEYNALRLEINYKKKKAKKQNKTKKTSWKLNNMLLNNKWITKEIKDKIKRYRQMTMKIPQSKTYGTQ